MMAMASGHPPPLLLAGILAAMLESPINHHHRECNGRKEAGT